MNDMTNLPAIPFSFDIAEMAAAYRAAAREGATPASTLLKMDRQGNWNLGVEAEPVDATQQFAVNPGGSQKGFICWSLVGTDKMGEIIVPLNHDIPELGPVPAGGRGWEYQLGISVRAIGGELDGREAVYRTGSGGGKRELSKFMHLMSIRMAAYMTDPKQDALMPIVTFSSDSYPNKKYGGQTFNPIINIVKWAKVPGPGATKAEALAKLEAVRPAKAAPKKNGKRK